MRRLLVDSSAVKSIGPDRVKHAREVAFKGGNVYRYFDVPERIWRALRAASSIGRFVIFRVKDAYRFRRMR